MRIDLHPTPLELLDAVKVIKLPRSKILFGIKTLSVNVVVLAFHYIFFYSETNGHRKGGSVTTIYLNVDIYHV